jgi:hypothetical protein
MTDKTMTVLPTEDEVSSLEMHLRLRLCSEDNPDETIDAKTLLKYVLAASFYLASRSDAAPIRNALRAEVERLRLENGLIMAEVATERKTYREKFPDADTEAEVEVLRAENERLREALGEIASFRGRDQQTQAEIARAALQSKEEK